MATTEEWARQQWQGVELGDKRRNARAVKTGTQMAAHPAASIPQQFPNWPDLKATYRLLHAPGVTHETLSRPHWLAVRQAAETSHGPVLFIKDDSSLDFSQRQATGLGRISNISQGLILHSCLAVVPGTPPQILGLAHQKVWARTGPPHKGRETMAEQYHRKGKETENWFGCLEQIGTVPHGACWVSVSDRGSDIFDYLRRATEQGWQCLYRMAHNRKIVKEDGDYGRLRDWLQTVPPAAEETLELRTRGDRAARQVVLSLAWGHTRIAPTTVSYQERRHAPVDVWVLHAYEDAPPAGEPPVEWWLLSTLPIENAQQAHERMQWYRQRWLIEEYHKALKTGCGIEASQLKEGQAIMGLLGFLSIIAVRLLQLRDWARNEPEMLASRVVDHQLLTFLCQLRKKDAVQMTVYQFWREVAKLGGFIGRKSDGEPGWQTLWRGWNYLYPRFEGYLIARTCG